MYTTTDASGQTDLADERLKQHADTLGLNAAQFDACLAGTSKEARIQRDINSGIAMGVTGTPTFFVGDEKVTGFKTSEQLGEIIDRHLSDN